MARDKLLPRERKFVQHLLDGLGKRDAAVAAGYPPGSAAVNASRLLSRERVLTLLREGAEKKLHAGAAIGANVLLELAEKAKSEDVRLRAAAALLAHSGLQPVTKHQTTHVIEDRRTDRELLEHARALAKQLGVAMPAGIVDAQFSEIQPPALPAPQPEPLVEPREPVASQVEPVVKPKPETPLAAPGEGVPATPAHRRARAEPA
jgi:phage terminase small subunit